MSWTEAFRHHGTSILMGDCRKNNQLNDGNSYLFSLLSENSFHPGEIYELIKLILFIL